MPTSTSTKETPRNALQFRSALAFEKAFTAKEGNGKASESTNGDDSGDLVPFTMTARTGDPIEHWYWGRVVHDMAGMQLNKDRIGVDYCHDDCEILGFADSFETTSGDLVIGGNLTPMPDDPDDRAAEVIHKQKLGVPYEASIDFSSDRPLIEFVPEGAAVDVNGRTLGGPLTVIRQWTLSRVAICPSGADPNTSTEFANKRRGESEKTVTVTTIGDSSKAGGAQQMSKVNTPATPAAGQAQAPNGTANAGNPAATSTATATPAATAATNAQQLTQESPAGATTGAKPAETPAAAVIAKEGDTAGDSGKPEQKYIAAFGDIGARWFLEKRPFEACAAEFVASLKQTHAGELDAIKNQFARDKEALEGQINAANAKLQAIGRGDPGVTFSNADGKGAAATESKEAQNLNPGTAKFAAGLKLPGNANAKK